MQKLFLERYFLQQQKYPSRDPLCPVKESTLCLPLVVAVELNDMRSLQLLRCTPVVPSERSRRIGQERFNSLGNRSEQILSTSFVDVRRAVRSRRLGFESQVGEEAFGSDTNPQSHGSTVVTKLKIIHESRWLRGPVHVEPHLATITSIVR